MLRSIFVHLISVYDRVNAPRLIRAEIISRISAVPHSVRQKNIWQVNCFIICLNYYFYLHSIIFIPHAGILMYSPFFTQIPVKSSVPSAGLNCTSCSWLEYLNPCIMDLLLESNPHTPDLFYKYFTRYCIVSSFRPPPGRWCYPPPIGAIQNLFLMVSLPI